MTNQDIRSKAARAGIRLWEIAARLGMTDSNFSRKLRNELPDEEKQRIFSIIHDIREGRENE